MRFPQLVWLDLGIHLASGSLLVALGNIMEVLQHSEVSMQHWSHGKEQEGQK